MDGEERVRLVHGNLQAGRGAGWRKTAEEHDGQRMTRGKQPTRGLGEEMARGSEEIRRIQKKARGPTEALGAPAKA